MLNKRTITALAIAISLFVAAIVLHRTFWTTGREQLFVTAPPETRTIMQIVKATGYLEVKDSMRIGSLVPGIIKRMVVDENDIVKKGQLIAEIDDGKEDTEVKAAEAAWQRAQATCNYLSHYYQRQKALYECKHISDDEFERVERDYKEALAEVDYRKAQHDSATLVFNNKQIKAPDSGLVIDKVSREGETVTLASPATILYTIAKDIKKMEAKVEIDESSIGLVKKGMETSLILDAYQRDTCTGKIDDVSRAPVIKSGNVSYTATVPIDNSSQKYFPNMSFDARIVIGKHEGAMAVPGYVFRLNRNTLKQIADALGYSFQELNAEERLSSAAKGNIETLWLLQKKAFVERAVEIGVDDYSFYEVVAGLEPTDQVIVDIADEDIMRQVFRRFFSSGFGNN